jgi:hypothetical protein
MLLGRVGYRSFVGMTGEEKTWAQLQGKRKLGRSYRGREDLGAVTGEEKIRVGRN